VIGRFRLFQAQDGTSYRVSISPRERKGRLGVHPALNAVTFETLGGRWIGSVPVNHRIGLEDLESEDLEELLDQAA